MNTKSIGLLASAVFVIGFIGFSLGDSGLTISEQPKAAAESASFIGHVETILADGNGVIKAYQQGDNAVMNQGKNCAAKRLFGSSAISTATLCGGPSVTTGNFTFIGLSNTASSVDTTRTSLPGEFFLSGGVCAGICRNSANTTATVSNVQEATTNGGSTIVKISKTFTLTNASATIRSAGLFNSSNPNTDAVFAIRNFTSPISMTNNDQLTVNWQITLN